MPHGRMRGVYHRVGMCDALSSSDPGQLGETMGFGEEYCYDENNKKLFIGEVDGNSEMIVLI